MEWLEREAEILACKVTLIHPSYPAKEVVSSKWDLMDPGNGIELIKVVERDGISIFEPFTYC